MAEDFHIEYVDTPPSRKWNIAPRCGQCIEVFYNEFSLEREDFVVEKLSNGDQGQHRK